MEPTVEPPSALPAGIGLGASTLELNEDFSKPGSFPTGTIQQGTYGYKNGAYQIKVTEPSSSVWSPHVLGKPNPVVSIRGTVTAPTAGTFGALYCGNAAGDFLYGGVSRTTSGSSASSSDPRSAFSTAVTSLPMRCPPPATTSRSASTARSRAAPTIASS